MPKKKGSRPDVVFVNINLTKQQAANLKATAFGLDDVENALSKLNESNYKVTFSYDDYNEAFSCFLIPTDPEDVNRGMILAGRGSTPLKSLKQVLYKHYTITEGAWLNYANPAREELDD